MFQFPLTLVIIFIFAGVDNFSQTAESWVRQVRGPAIEQVLVVESDGLGNVYSSGTYYGPVTVEGDSLPYDGNRAFVIKYNQFGNIIWRKTFKDVSCIDLKVGKSGDVVMCGSFSGTVVIGNSTLVATGSSDAFLTKFTPNGNELWTRRAGGNWTDDFNAITLDKYDNILVVGTTWSSSFTYANNTSSTSAYQSIIHLMTDPQGNLKWMKSYGGNSFDEGHRVTVDKFGNSYVSGKFASDTVYFDSFKLPNYSSWAYYLYKADSTGNVIWTTTTSPIYAIQCDNSGDVVVTGRFVSKLNQNGITLWSKAFSTNEVVGSTDVFVDSQNQIFVSFYTNEDTVTYNGSNLILKDAGTFILQISSTGQMLEHRAFGNDKKDVILSIAQTANGGLCGGGNFHSDLTVGNSVKVDYCCYSDGFTFKLSELTTSLLQLVADNKIVVFPNPSKGLLQLSGTDEDVEIVFSDAFGACQKVIILLRDNRKLIDASQLATGIYFLSVRTSRGLLTSRVIIEK